MLPWMSATKGPTGDAMIVDISGVFWAVCYIHERVMDTLATHLEYLWGTSKVVDVLHRSYVEERKLPPLGVGL